MWASFLPCCDDPPRRPRLLPVLTSCLVPMACRVACAAAGGAAWPVGDPSRWRTGAGSM